MVLVNDVGDVTSSRAPAESSWELPVLGRLGVVPVEEELAEPGLLLEDLDRRADVGTPGEEEPVVLEVEEPRRRGRLEDPVHPPGVALLVRSAEDELEEGEEPAHLGAVGLGGAVVDADEPVDPFEVLAGVQERADGVDEQAQPAAAGDRQGHLGLRAAGPGGQPGDQAGVVPQAFLQDERDREVPVPLEARPFRFRERRRAEQRVAGAERLLGPPRPEGRDPELVEGLVGVGGGLDEERAGTGRGKGGRAAREPVRLLPPVLAAGAGGGTDERLGPGGVGGGAILVLPEHLVGGPAQRLETERGLIAGPEDLLLPASHRDATPVGLESEVGPTGVAPALREVEGEAGVAGVGSERRLEEGRVLLVFLRVQAPASEAPGDDPVVSADAAQVGGGSVARGILVEDPDVVPRERPPEDLESLVFEVRTEPEMVGVGREPREVGGARHEVVGVEHPEVVGRRELPGERQGLGAVGAEVPPGAFEDVARDAFRREGGPDEVRRPVGGSRVDDDDVGDPGERRRESLPDDVGLVLRDHHETDRGPVAKAERRSRRSGGVARRPIGAGERRSGAHADGMILRARSRSAGPPSRGGGAAPRPQ